MKQKLPMLLTGLAVGIILGWSGKAFFSTHHLRFDAPDPPGTGIGFVRDAPDVSRLLAVSWGDGKYGKAFYGAYVYLEPTTGGQAVKAQVQIGRGNPMFHDCGELGRVVTAEEAVAKWGKIDWQDDGLHIGTGTNAFFLPRAKLESHR
jgi:hypothetical protein